MQRTILSLFCIILYSINPAHAMNVRRRPLAPYLLFAYDAEYEHVQQLDQQLHAIDTEECADCCYSTFMTGVFASVGCMPLIKDLTGPARVPGSQLMEDSLIIPQALALAWLFVARPFCVRAEDRRQARTNIRFERRNLVPSIAHMP